MVAPRNIGDVEVSRGELLQFFKVVLVDIDLQLAILDLHTREIVVFPAPVHTRDGGHFFPG